MKTGIYLIQNKLNGECYVGKSLDIEERWKHHIRDSKKPEFPIHKAIAKYGPDNFSFSIIEECNADELNEREIYWINELDTYKNGYNCTLGGEGSNKGKNSYSPEYSKAYYEANKEKHNAASKKRYEANKDDPEFKEKVKDYQKAYYEKNKEKVKEASKAYYEENKDKCKAVKKDYKEANKDKVSAYQKAYYEAHNEKLSTYYKAYYEAHKFTPTPDHTDMPLW